MPICISTGSCFDLGLTPIQAVHYLERFADQIDGIELCLANPAEAEKFQLDQRAQALFDRFLHNSIHLPFEKIKYMNDAFTRKILEKMTILAHQINAKNLVVHPSNVKSIALLEQSGLPISIENMNAKTDYRGYQTIEDLKRLFDQHPTFGFTLDLTHALSNHINPDDFLVFRDRLRSIHVLGRYWNGKKWKEHGFYSESDDQQREKSRKALRLGLPLVIEADFTPEKESLIGKEIETLRKITGP